MILKKVVCDLEKGRCCVSVNFGLCRPCAIGTGERRNKTCQLLINLVSSCVLKLDNASVRSFGGSKISKVLEYQTIPSSSN